MNLPTAAQILERNDQLAAEQFKHELHSIPATNERFPFAFSFGAIGGIGLALGGSALAVTTQAVSHGSPGHYAVCLGGLAVGVLAGAALGWFNNDGVEQAQAKLENTNEQIGTLMEHVATRDDLAPDFGSKLVDRRGKIKQSLVENEKFKKDFSKAAVAGIAAGATAAAFTRNR